MATCCRKSKPPQLIRTLEVPRQINLRTAEEMMTAFNNDFMARFHQHLGVKKDVLAGSKTDYGKGCVTRTAFKEMLQQSYSELDAQCTPAITGRYDSLYACHSYLISANIRQYHKI